MIEDLLLKLEENEEEFNSFEVSFLENIEEVNEERHLTTVGMNGGKSQVEVLVEIYEEHCGRTP